MELLKQVYSLIRTLDQQEKNLFVALSSIKGSAASKEYFALYEFLDKQQVLDPLAVEQRYVSKGGSKQQSNDLQYLLEQLIASMQFSKASSSLKVNMYASITAIENLIEKEQYELALREIKLAIKNCENQDLIPALLILQEYKNFCNFFLDGTNSAATGKTLKEMLDQSFELFVSKKSMYLAFQFGKCKQSFDHSHEAIYLNQMLGFYNQFSKLMKSIERPLSANELLLYGKIKYEFAFCEKKYEKALKNIYPLLDIVSNDIADNIQAFWVYLSFNWSGFNAACKAAKKSVARSFISKSESYLKVALIKNSSEYSRELKKFVLRQKIQWIYYFEDYSMLRDYAIAIDDQAYSSSDFSINSLLQSRIQICICHCMSGQVQEAYEIMRKLAVADKLNHSFELMMTYHIVKILYEIDQKQFDVCDYSLNNFKRYINTHTKNLQQDIGIYKDLLLLFNKRSVHEKGDFKGYQISDIKEPMYLFVHKYISKIY